jgi:hypothetical protein
LGLFLLNFKSVTLFLLLLIFLDSIVSKYCLFLIIFGLVFVEKSALKEEDKSSIRDESEEALDVSSQRGLHSLFDFNRKVPLVNDLHAFIPFQKPFLDRHVYSDGFMQLLESMDITIDTDDVFIVDLKDSSYMLIVALRSLLMNLCFQVKFITKDMLELGPWYTFSYTDEMLETILVSYIKTVNDEDSISIYTLHVFFLLLLTDLADFKVTFKQCLLSSESLIRDQLEYYKKILKIIKGVIKNHPDDFRDFFRCIARHTGEILHHGYSAGELRSFSSKAAEHVQEMNIVMREFSMLELNNLNVLSSTGVFDHYRVKSSELIRINKGGRLCDILHSVHNYQPLNDWLWLTYAASLLYCVHSMNFPIHEIITEKLKQCIKSDGYAVTLFLQVMQNYGRSFQVDEVSKKKRNSLFLQYIEFFLPVWDPMKKILTKKNFLVNVPYRFDVEKKNRHKAVSYEVSVVFSSQDNSYTFDYKLLPTFHMVGGVIEIKDALRGSVFLKQLFLSKVRLLFKNNSELKTSGLLAVIEKANFPITKLMKLFVKLQELNRDLGVEDLQKLLSDSTIEECLEMGRLPVAALRNRSFSSFPRKQSIFNDNYQQLHSSNRIMKEAKKAFSLT